MEKYIYMDRHVKDFLLYGKPCLCIEPVDVEDYVLEYPTS